MDEDTTLDVANRAIENGNLALLLGLREGSRFEAKGRLAYNLDLPQDRYELAKDVSAFANSEGGLVIIGLQTIHLDVEATDEVSDLDLIPESEFSPRKYSGVIREYVSPAIIGLLVQWVEDSQSQGSGVGVIHVPPQDENKRPFIIAKVVEDGAQIKQVVFGYAQRVGSDSVPWTAEQIRSALKAGMDGQAQRISRIEGRLSGIEEGQAEIREMLSHAKRPSEPDPAVNEIERLRQRLKDFR